MSGRPDPTRTSRIALTKAQVAHRVNSFTKANPPEDRGGRRHDRRAARADLTADLVDPPTKPTKPATKPAMTTPAVPDQGGRGAQPAAFAEQREEEAEPATSTTGPTPIRAVPLRARPPAASATSAPKKKKRAAGGNMARLEGQAKRQRQQGRKKVPEMAGAAIKFTWRCLGPVRVLRRRSASEGADAAFDTCAHAARCRCAARGYAASRGAFLRLRLLRHGGAPRASRSKGLP
ncbi:hypothetical protein QYE76_040332 [Lolium multiflorum]|uniref:Uncharacterized protein n=1 Tax=Lolium multiflorum TaxID=4521 RepID=A0AAD8TCV7_LOLMU|nr:hypothetical protein QYE76_040332 [Lolium multiflorum]